MSRYEHGRILAVNETTLGSELVGDHAAGVSSLTVEDAVDFDEDGGWLSINGQVAEYTTYDDDTGEITLRGTLDAAALEGDRVDLWDELRQVVTVDKIAQIELDGDDDNTDPLEAIIPLHLLDDLTEGIRGTRGESVLLEQDGDEWRIVDVLGLAASGASGTQFWQDSHTVTTTGQQTIALTHEPKQNSEHLYWNGLYQPASEWSRNGSTITVPDSTGLLALDDVISVEYAYLAGAGGHAVAIDWASPGWKYQQVAADDTTDYSATAYDDSAWTVGTSPFGNTTGVPVPIAPNTTWAAGTSLWIRRALPAGRNFRVDIYIEDNCTAYFNGVEVGSAVNGDTGKVETVLQIEVPDVVANQSAGNVLAIRCNDEVPPSVNSTVYADIRVVYSTIGGA